MRGDPKEHNIKLFIQPLKDLGVDVTGMWPVLTPQNNQGHLQALHSARRV